MKVRLTHAAIIALSVTLAAALLLPGLGAAPFDDPGEGQHAEIAREMAARGDWLLPRLNGVRYFDKPPLLYWLGAAAFSLLGVHEWSARLTPVVGTLLATAATALLGARLLGRAGGLLAAGGLVSSGLFIAFGRYVRPETLFVAAIQWGLTGLLVGLAKPVPARAHAWLRIGWAALGVASLAKDPIGLLGPPIAVALTLALGGRLRPLSRWLSPAGALLGLSIGLGWYLVVALRQPGFVWYTIVDNHLLNAVRLRHFPDEDVPLSTVEFLAVSVLGAVPWIIPAALAVTWMVRRRAWRNPEETAWTALGFWAVGLLALFTLVPFKLPHYALPAYPAIALLAARGWQERPQWTRGLIIAHVALFAVLAGILGVAARSDGRVFVEAILSAIDVYTRKEAAVGETAPFPSWSVLAPLVARTALVFGLASAALLVLLLRQAHELGRWVVLGAMLAAMPAVTAAVSAVASSRAVRTMAVEIRRALGPQDLLVYEGPIENAGALELYSGRRPVLLEAKRTVLGFGSTFPDAREMFWDAERFRREWCAGRRILLVTPRAHQQSSIVARLPVGSLRLRVAENGRRLYETGPAGSRGAC